MERAVKDNREFLTSIQKRNPYNHDAVAPDTPMVNVFLEDRWVKVPKGMNIVEAAKLHGKFLPHYCYHPKLEVVGNCRMCLFEFGMPKSDKDRKPILGDDGLPVEIMWMPKPMIGCATAASEGMGIRISSPMAEECRKGVMEFLLINHPLDCPICDQAGECKLQEFSVEYGNADSRFVEQKVHKPKRVDIGERIVLDDERCIMCSRCVRFAEEVVDDGCLGFTDHGSHTTLTIHPDKRFDNNYSLNTVDICPVGALTSKDFRFKMRVWFLKETKSICTGCSTGCNVTVGSRRETVYRLTPRENDEVNSHWMCDQGRLGFHYIHDEKRLIQPQIRTGSKPMAAGWTDVFSEIQVAMQGKSGEGVAILASAKLTNEELFLISELRKELGGDSVITDTVQRTREGDDFLKSPDCNPNTAGAALLGVTQDGHEISKIKDGIDAGTIKALLVFHEDPVAAGLPEETLKKLDVLIVQDILPNPATPLAHFVLPGASFAEKKGTMIIRDGRLQRLNRAIPLPGTAMEDFEILLKLRAAITGGNGLHSIQEVFKAMGAAHDAFAGLTLAGVGDLGIQLGNGSAARETAPVTGKQPV